MNLIKQLRVQPGSNVKLKQRAAGDTLGIDEDRAEKAFEHHVKKLGDLQEILYAEHRRSLLIVLQGMDASGKDGTIKHVMSGVNPQSCSVTSFKQPTTRELDHDFLWRIHAAAPGKGDIGIFNRSQYEDVLIARVHNLVPKSVWQSRYEQINNFEQMLSENDVHILKFFLHISKQEQEARFEARLSDPRKNWKSSPADFEERQYWDDYQKAYEDALERCSTKHAPWFVIPSDHKWFRNYAIARIIIDTLESLKMEFPKADPKQLAALTKSGGKVAAKE